MPALLDGIGSLGAVVQGRVTTTISQAFGWNALFLVFVGLAALAAAALAAVARRETAAR